MRGRQPCTQCLRGTANCLAGARAVVLGVTCTSKHQPCFTDRRTPLRVACHTVSNFECLRAQSRGIRSVPGPECDACGQQQLQVRRLEGMHLGRIRIADRLE